MLVGVGISHFLTSGDVRELCGDDTKIVFSRKLPPTLDTNGKPLPNQSCQDCTYPIFGMAIAPDESVWAVSAGLVLFHLRDGDAEEVAMPEPEDWHGLMLNRPTPGLIALWTMANARVSLSGTTPLLVRVDSTE